MEKSQWERGLGGYKHAGYWLSIMRRLTTDSRNIPKIIMSNYLYIMIIKHNKCAQNFYIRIHHYHKMMFQRQHSLREHEVVTFH